MEGIKNDVRNDRGRRPAEGLSFRLFFSVLLFSLLRLAEGRRFWS